MDLNNFIHFISSADLLLMQDITRKSPTGKNISFVCTEIFVRQKENRTGKAFFFFPHSLFNPTSF